jgi:hypothetical protein
MPAPPRPAIALPTINAVLFGAAPMKELVSINGGERMRQMLTANKAA